MNAPKIVLITGASSGIGAATALRLAEAGHHVTLGARREDRLEALSEEIRKAGGSADHLRLDVTSADSVNAFVSTAHDRHGRVDVLVNNAGVMPLSRIDSLRVDEWSRMIDVNLRGVLHTVAAVLPIMKEQGTGHFVTVTSALATEVSQATAVYGATKAGAELLADGLRKEHDNIRSTVISPSWVESELLNEGGDPDVMGWVRSMMDKLQIPARTIADAIAFAIAQPPEVDVTQINIRTTGQYVR